MDRIVPLDINKEQISFLELSPSHRISHIEDLDKDGIVEIIVSTKYSIKVYKLLDGSLMWQFDLMEGELLSTHLRDINLDGNNEILLLVENNDSRWVYILDTDGNLISTIDVGNKEFTLGHLKPVKIKNQNVLILLSEANDLVFFTLEGALIWRLKARILHYALGDFNKDGKEELLVIYRKGEIVHGALIDLTKFEPVWAKDIDIIFNRDPYIEEKRTGNDSLLLAFFNEKLVVVRASDGKKIAERETDALEIFSGVADVDGDGERELVLTGVNEFDFSTSVEIIWPQDGKNFLFNIPIMISDVRIGDYDGDGKDEIALIGFNEVRFLGINGEKWSIKDIFDSEIYASHGEDFDRDGIPEILIIGEKGVAIIDLLDKSILWMDNNLVLHEIDYLLGIGDILPIDIDGDGDDEWLLIDDSSESKTKILLLKGSYGSIKELWSREIKVDYIKDVEILYPNGLILLVTRDELIALNKEGEIMWRCKNCPSDYILFADTTGDGNIEIIVFQRKIGIKVVSSKNGVVLWSYRGEIMGAYLGDVNSDGKYEIIVNRPDAIQILDGSNGSSLYTLLTESKFKRVDVFDVDSDDTDEIILYRKTGLLLIKDYTIKWEMDFLDPMKIRRIEKIFFSSSKNTNLLVISGKTLYVIDPFQGSIIDKIEMEKYISNYIIADIDGNGREEILLISKNKKEITIIGNDGYRHITIPVGRNYKLKKIHTKKVDIIYLMSNRSLWVLDPRSYEFKRLLILEEKLIDIVKLPKFILILAREDNKYESKFKIYKIHMSIDPKPTINNLKLLTTIEETKLSGITYNNKNSLELLFSSGNKTIIVDWKNRKLFTYLTNSGFSTVIKFDDVALSPLYSYSKGMILAWKENTLYIIDPYHVENLTIKIPSKVLQAVLGDIDGDKKEEVIVLTDRYELMLVDPFLYRLGCKKVYRLGSIEPINFIEQIDIDSDFIQELLLVKPRGIEIIKLNLFNRFLLDTKQHPEKESFPQDELTKIKIRALCDKEISKIQAKIEMLKAKSKVGSWKASLSRKDTSSEEN